jgi:hypothetical protein
VFLNDFEIYLHDKKFVDPELSSLSKIEAEPRIQLCCS